MRTALFGSSQTWVSTVFGSACPRGLRSGSVETMPESSSAMLFGLPASSFSLHHFAVHRRQADIMPGLMLQQQRRLLHPFGDFLRNQVDGLRGNH